MRRIFLILLLLVVCVWSGRSATESQAYTDSGKVDFDLILDRLEPYGSWEKINEGNGDKGEGKVWAWFPQAAQDPAWRPFQKGRWSYSDFGWAWESEEPFGFATYHYGHWGLAPGKGWFWVPSTRWDAATVEWRAAGDYYGWRPQTTNRFGEPAEAPEATRSRVGEWWFVPKTAILSPLDKKDGVSDPEKVRQLLAQSEVGVHQRSIPNYREFTRNGPAPEDVAVLIGGEIPAARRIMSLPSWDSPVPPEFGLNYLFFYKPKFYQDAGGVVRRIGVWCERKKGGTPIDTQKVAESLMEEVILQKAEEIRKKKKSNPPEP
jgi:hypothetical protein